MGRFWAAKILYLTVRERSRSMNLSDKTKIYSARPPSFRLNTMGQTLFWRSLRPKQHVKLSICNPRFQESLLTIFKFHLIAMIIYGRSGNERLALCCNFGRHLVRRARLSMNPFWRRKIWIFLVWLEWRRFLVLSSDLEFCMFPRSYDIHFSSRLQI